LNINYLKTMLSSIRKLSYNWKIVESDVKHQQL
jgi:hypothetical protein